MTRSILAVVAGSVTWMAVALGTDFLIMSLFPHWVDSRGHVDSVPVLFLMLSYSTGYEVLGGYVTGWVARRREVAHALALGLLQLAMGIVATIKMWGFAPAWWQLALLALVVPATVAGGQWRALRKSRRRRGAATATA
ncbi:MAG TPA: hypothetical protein VF538_04990 [Pyrinomonadaceae bacterium]|jgi:hypothetical protein